jgi:hypothetical protein
VDLNQGPLPYQESSRAFDLPRLALQLPVPSTDVHYRPLAAAAIVTQLVTHPAFRLNISPWVHPCGMRRRLGCCTVVLHVLDT